ncbi:MAG: ATP-binding protein [Bacteroidota bacterium]
MKRKIIYIDEEKCNGCGLCIPNCVEGALSIIDGKARLVSDVYCDGLGACLGHCPEDAISIIEREAGDFDEKKAMEHAGHTAQTENDHTIAVHVPVKSQLKQWPVQMHLLNPGAKFLEGADLLLAADCTAYAIGDFHDRYLAGKVLAIACPKLDSNKEIYLQKLIAMIDHSGIKSITVLIMEVPCCRGLLALAKAALENAERQVPLSFSVIGIDGNEVSPASGF